MGVVGRSSATRLISRFLAKRQQRLQGKQPGRVLPYFVKSYLWTFKGMPLRAEMSEALTVFVARA